MSAVGSKVALGPRYRALSISSSLSLLLPFSRSVRGAESLHSLPRQVFPFRKTGALLKRPGRLSSE